MTTHEITFKNLLLEVRGKYWKDDSTPGTETEGFEIESVKFDCIDITDFIEEIYIREKVRDNPPKFSYADGLDVIEEQILNEIYRQECHEFIF